MKYQTSNIEYLLNMHYTRVYILSNDINNSDISISEREINLNVSIIYKQTFDSFSLT